MQKVLRLKLKSKSELHVFGAMIKFAYQLQCNKLQFQNDDEMIAVIGMAWQLCSVFEKVASLDKYFNTASTFTIQLNPGQVAAIINFKELYTNTDPFASVVVNEILSSLDKYIHSL